jgi:transcription initiation factor TFIID subunit 9B
MSSQPANIVDVMRQLLSSMDINDYEPAVPHMLVELFYRHVTTVLKEAQRACDFRKSKDISDDDLRFATGTVIQPSLLHPPRPDAMQALASRVNAQPLPRTPSVPELVLPGEETSLLEPNFYFANPQRQ